MPQGLFVTLEGIDFCGKSTQAELLVGRLERAGASVLSLRDPGGTRISERVREILLDPRLKEMDPVTELLLYEAARAQMVAEEIRPALERGTVVVCDRFYDSTTAYQGYGRGLALDDVETANRLGSIGTVPHVTFILDISVEESLRRERSLRTQADRMEAESARFRERVRQGYLALATKEKDRIEVVDGEQAIQTIHEKIWKRVEREARNRGIL